MLETTKIGFSYSKKSRVLFDDLSFSINKGDVLAILGPNGVGRTTLLRCLMNFLPLKNGDVSLLGKPVSAMKSSDFWKKISYVPQAKKLVFGYSALNMVVMGLSQNIRIGITVDNIRAFFGVESDIVNTCYNGQIYNAIVPVELC